MLVPTFYDVRKYADAKLYDAVRKDVQTLKDLGTSTPVRELDSFPSGFEQIWGDRREQLVRFVAQEHGTSPVAIQEAMRTDPEAQSILEQQETGLSVQYFALLNFELFGLRTFYLQDGLVQQLACTEMNVVAELLQLPFPACMFVLTSRDAIDALYRLHLASEPKQADSTQIDYEAPLSAFLVMSEPSTEQPYRELSVVVYHANRKRTFLMVTRRLCLKNGSTLDDALSTDWAKLDTQFEQRRQVGEDGGWHPVDDGLFYTEGRLFFRIILNAALYITSADAEMESRPPDREALGDEIANIESPSERKAVKQAARHASRLPYIVVGASIPKLQPLEEVPTSALVQKRTLSIRFTVRGHWRNQACGPGMKEHTLRFIKPYNKGPEMAELINKPYLVRER